MKRLISLWLFILGLASAQAQVEGVWWERISDIGAVGQFPSRGQLVVSPADEKLIFMATRTGLYRSEDEGYNWQKVPLPFEGDVSGLPFAPAPDNPQTLYVAGWQSLLRSIDNGQHWEKLFEPKFGGIFTLAVHPRVPTLLYAAGGTFPVLFGDPGQAVCYRSIDGGKTWQESRMEDGIPVGWLAPHPVDPNIVYAVTEYEGIALGIGGNVFRSDDQGVTWRKIADGRRAPLLIHPKQPNRIATIHARQHRFDGKWFEFSLDGGHTWARGAGMEDQELEYIALGIEPDTLYAATSRGTYYSVDGGLNWRLLNELNAYAMAALATNTDRWQVEGHEVRGLLLLTNFGVLYRLRVDETPRPVSPQGKAALTWGALKREAQE